MNNFNAEIKVTNRQTLKIQKCVEAFWAWLGRKLNKLNSIKSEVHSYNDLELIKLNIEKLNDNLYRMSDTYVQNEVIKASNSVWYDNKVLFHIQFGESKGELNKLYLTPFSDEYRDDLSQLMALEVDIKGWEVIPSYPFYTDYDVVKVEVGSNTHYIRNYRIEGFSRDLNGKYTVNVITTENLTDDTQSVIGEFFVLTHGGDDCGVNIVSDLVNIINVKRVSEFETGYSLDKLELLLVTLIEVNND